MTDTRINISVQAADFDLGVEQAKLAKDQAAGALTAFIGTVRGDDNLHALTLEHYPGMTERTLADIAEQAANRWPLLDIRIIHRFGELAIGEQIVLVMTRSPHRRAAFEAAEFLMDFLKTDAPFWKKMKSAKGDSWVDAKDSDVKARARWSR